jgi:predicted GNAT family acetyltransferase
MISKIVKKGVAKALIKEKTEYEREKGEMKTNVN